jgi:hypothetical protein
VEIGLALSVRLEVRVSLGRRRCRMVVSARKAGQESISQEGKQGLLRWGCLDRVSERRYAESNSGEAQQVF